MYNAHGVYIMHPDDAEESRLDKETDLNLSWETSRNNDSEDPSPNVTLDALFFLLYSLFIIHQELIYHTL